MTLPDAGLELSSNDWELVLFEEFPDEVTDRSASFAARILHKPTGLVLSVRNSGHFINHDYDGERIDPSIEATRDEKRIVREAWDNFAQVSLPVLRNRVQRFEEAETAFLATLWDEGNYSFDDLRDEVFELFCAEHERKLRSSSS